VLDPVSVTAPVPAKVTEPVPLMLPPKITASLWSNTRAELLVMSPVMLPVVLPLPICSVPALIVVPPA
jgi:hypothetical protein